MKTICIALLAGIAACAFVQPVLAAKSDIFTEQILHSFCSLENCADGKSPYAGLIDVKGTLYSTTPAGGASNYGTVFSIDPNTGTETVVYSFCSQQNCTDGAAPVAGLIDVDGILYGTTEGGGAHSGGTVFSLDLATGTETVLYSFCSGQGCLDGEYPEANLVDVNKNLYGTTAYGGSYGSGALFMLNRTTGAEKLLYSFPIYATPLAGLIDVDGTLYGTTSDYGHCYPSGCGSVFSFNLMSGAVTFLHKFGRREYGREPMAGLIDINGILYGTTTSGGNRCDCGTVFSLDPATGAETVLHAFADGPDGDGPLAGLTDVNGVLYGTTYAGGPSRHITGGTVFSLDLTTGAESVVYDFCARRRGCGGFYPRAGLIDVKGKLYGTTTSGGTSDGGTVFVLKAKR
ncbi:MAG TPA: choice-of-anchor tandem repeat GloVer-containing protein [Rhizomicrobium sp.]|nr:choice-of-anchor tandem repeat GloVer-containing protein [Rhizomicrobium sp.]